MPADIKLEGEVVVAEGTVKILGSDLQLDSMERRVGNTSPPHRRALVHGFNDDLVINFNADYTGGLTLDGPVRLAGFRASPPQQPLVEQAPGGGLIQGMDLAPTVADRLGEVGGIHQSPGGSGQVARLPLDISKMFDSVEDPLNLISEIRRLRAAIRALNERVEALEQAR